MGTAPRTCSGPVLIVDDDTDLADLIALVVHHAGYESLVAYDGHHALTLARRVPPALVMTDLRMPGMTGNALIDSLRAEWGVALPIIVLSAAPPSQIEASSADAVLSKPFKTGDLLALLDRLLQA
jgi:DNA-binding response OmpR family regulator